MLKLDNIEKTNSKAVVIIEAPLLIEAGMHNICDEVWVVTADEESLLKRIQKRDALSTDEARRRISAQLSVEELLSYATRVFENNSDEATLRAKIPRVDNI